MTDPYEKKMFDFFTENENFQTLLKVYSHFSFVKEKLILDFWKQVTDKVVEMVGNNYPAWSFIETLKDGKSANLIIYKESWISNGSTPFVGIKWDNLFGNSYYGVWADKNSSYIEISKLKEEMRPFDKKNGYKSDSEWWYLWKNGLYDFTNNNNLSFILPNNTESVINHYADDFLSFIKFEPQIDKALRQYETL